MKTSAAVTGLLLSLISTSAMAFIVPTAPKIEAKPSLAENVVYKGTPVKPSDLVEKATYALEASMPSILASMQLPSCTATLIAKDILLTAAHCFHDNPDIVYKVKYNVPGTKKTNSLKVVAFKIHEQYVMAKNAKGSDITDNDIALIKVERAIPGGIPAQLPKKTWTPASVSSLLVAGYGMNGDKMTLEEMKQNPEIMALVEKSKQPGISENELGEVVGQILTLVSVKPLLWTKSKAQMHKKEGQTISQMLLQGGQPICSGDSGGPSYTRSANSSLVVVGVHSTGTSECDGIRKNNWWSGSLEYSYDTFVPFYIDWIQATAAELNN